MARSSITSTSKDLITDDGSVLVSVIHGEQVRLNLTIGWITNLTGYTITAKIVEGNNDSFGTKPTQHATSPQITELTVANGLIIDADSADNLFDVVIPETLIANWDQAPSPGTPVYGFIGLELQDTATGTAKQIYKPMRGLVEVRYSPTEAS